MSNDIFDDSYIKYISSSDPIGEMKKQFEQFGNSEFKREFRKESGAIEELNIDSDIELGILVTMKYIQENKDRYLEEMRKKEYLQWEVLKIREKETEQIRIEFERMGYEGEQLEELVRVGLGLKRAMGTDSFETVRVMQSTMTVFDIDTPGMKMGESFKSVKKALDKEE